MILIIYKGDLRWSRKSGFLPKLKLKTTRFHNLGGGYLWLYGFAFERHNRHSSLLL